jgi:urease accessory protein
MLRATKAGHFHAPVADTVVLDHEERSRRRGVVKTVTGMEFLVDLPDAPALRRGDGYVLEDGRLIEIVGAPEELLEVRGQDPLHTARIAYHLGNRHLECEISARHIRIRRDHVIADMLRGLSAKVVEVEAPFHPEGGAYHHGGQAPDHGHDHGHDHAHDHVAHNHHTHGPGCGHDHSHDPAHNHGHSHEHDHGHGHDHSGKHTPKHEH